MTYICIGKLTIIGSDNGLLPGRRQAITWTNAAIFLIRPLGTNFSEILIGNRTFSFKELHLKISSVKWRPFCLCLNVITGLTVIYNRPWSSQMRTPWSMNLESYTGEWFSWSLLIIYIFQSMGQIFFVEFQRNPLKFYIYTEKYVLDDLFILIAPWFKSS